MTGFLTPIPRFCVPRAFALDKIAKACGMIRSQTMELGYNISFTIAAVVIGAVLFLIVAINYSSTDLVNRRFRYFLIASLTMYAMNIATVFTNGIAKDLPHWFNVLFNSLYFLSTIAVSLLFFNYCASLALKNASKRNKRIVFWANMGALSLYVIVLIVNAFNGWFFYFDYSVPLPYTHGWFFMPVTIFTLVFVFESIVFFIWKRKQFNTRQIICTTLFFAAFFLSYGLQLFAFPNVLLSDFGCAIGSLIVFFSLETPDYVKLIATLQELNDLKGSLEQQVASRTEELNVEKASYEELTLETLTSLANLIDAKDHYTNGHSFRVAAYAKGLAEKLGLPREEAERIYLAGLIHDVGKIGISEAILTKPGKLTDEEFAIIKSHSAIGGDILHGIKEFPVFQQVAKSHHERYDGSGYPNRLGGQDIPIPARIVAVCDSFDAMTSDRSYRKALSDDIALSELRNGVGTQFDPEVVQAFLSLYDSFPDSIRKHVDELASGLPRQDR